MKSAPKRITPQEKVNWGAVFCEPLVVVGICIIALVILINGLVWVYNLEQYTYIVQPADVDAVELTDNGKTIWYEGQSLDIPQDQDIAVGDTVWISYKLRYGSMVIDREVVRCIKF